MRDYKVEKDFVYEGYRCAVLGMSLGHRCGYVGLPKSHPLYGAKYMDLLEDIDVHGGLTYSSYANNYPVESEGLWWLGFDCGHCDDGRDFELIRELTPPAQYSQMMALERMFPTGFGVVRTADYVEENIKSMVAQIKELEKGNCNEQSKRNK